MAVLHQGIVQTKLHNCYNTRPHNYMARPQNSSGKPFTNSCSFPWNHVSCSGSWQNARESCLFFLPPIADPGSVQVDVVPGCGPGSESVWQWVGRPGPAAEEHHRHLLRDTGGVDDQRSGLLQEQLPTYVSAVSLPYPGAQCRYFISKTPPNLFRVVEILVIATKVSSVQFVGVFCSGHFLCDAGGGCHCVRAERIWGHPLNHQRGAPGNQTEGK